MCTSVKAFWMYFVPVKSQQNLEFCWGVKQTAKKFTFCWFWPRQNTFKKLERCIYRVWGLPNPMVLVKKSLQWTLPEKSTLQVKSSIKWGEIASKWNGTYTAMLLGSHCTPTEHLCDPMSKPSHQKSRKTIITQKVPVTQSSNIVHCNQHTQTPACAKCQGF